MCLRIAGSLGDYSVIYLKEDPKVLKEYYYFRAHLLHDVNARVHANTGAKGNLVTAERDLNILQFESPLSTSERLAR